MVEFFGSRSDRKTILRKAGSMSQLAYIKPYEFTAGKEKGVRACDVSNGTGLDFTVLEDKCLDIIRMKYKGINLGYLPKSGIVSPALADMNGTEFMRSISGGMLYTCGLLNVGAPCEDSGMTHFFHGHMKNTPADHVNFYQGWEEDDYVLRLAAEMREAAIFNDNLRLGRTLSVKSGGRSVALADEVENQGFETQGLMLLYHVNVGYPVLDDDARLLIAARETMANDDNAQAGIGEFARITGPADGFAEHVFLHKPACDAGGMTGAAVVNDRLGLGVFIRFSTRELPNLVQWKSMRSGDYAMGIMPATCFVRGRIYEKQHGTLIMVKPFEKVRFGLEIGVLDGKEEIAEFENFIGSLK